MPTQRSPCSQKQFQKNPWKTVTDLFSWNSCGYLSRYFEIKRLHNINTAAIIHKIKAVFARYQKKLTVITGHAIIAHGNSSSLQSHGVSSTSLGAPAIPIATSWPKRLSKLQSGFSQRPKKTRKTYTSVYWSTGILLSTAWNLQPKSSWAADCALSYPQQHNCDLR